MCVIAISKKGNRQPNEKELFAMWKHNPDGAGYMYSRNNKVFIHKGFMTFSDFINAIRAEHFSRKDSVIYHFRISTQAGKTPFMTHPFPITDDLSLCEKLDIICPIAIAHNGIIPVTSNPNEKRYSDTALFVTRFLSKLINNSECLTDSCTLETIEMLGGFSKFAILEKSGQITTIGNFTKLNGILLSNTYHVETKWRSCYEYNV